MKKIIAILLAALMLVSAVALTGCGNKKSSLDAIKDAKVLTVYTEAGFAPYEFYYNNEIVGVDIAIMQAVADKLGVELTVTDVDFNSIVAAVQTGKANCGAAGITINAERLESVNFSNPYSSTEQYLIVADTNDSIKTIADLSGKSVGVQNGTTSDLLIDSLMKDGTLTDTTLTPYTTSPLAAASIGKIDAVVADKLTAQIIVTNNSGLKTFPLVDADGKPVSDVEEYGIAVAKGNDDLLAIVNEVIDDMLKSGKMDQLVEEYSAKATEVGA